MNEEKHAAMRALDVLQMRGLEGKRDYVNSLEERGDEQALSLLVECLCDESGYLRDLAESALGRMGEDTVEVLLPHLSQGLWYTRVSVARVLGRVGAVEALPGLVHMAADDNGAVAEAALQAMTTMAAGGRAVPVARTVHGAAPGVRERLLGWAERNEPDTARQLARLLGDRELMTAREEEVLRADAQAAGVHENLEWEVLTGKSASGDAAESDDIESDDEPS